MMPKQVYSRRDITFIIIFFILVLVVWGGLSAASEGKMDAVEKTDGICDLRGFDFENAIAAVEQKEWDTWPQNLYTPEDFALGIPGEPSIVTYDDYANTDYFTHRLTLLLPPGNTYVMPMKTSPYAQRLFIGGEEIGSVGIPATSRDEMTPGAMEITYSFTPQTERVEIIVQTANFVHGRSGCRPPVISIGTVENILELEKIASFFNALVIGCLLTSFLYHLSLFLLNTRRTTTLLFSVCCLVMALLDKRLLYLFFPDISWYADVRFEYAVYYLMTLSLVWFIHKQFPRMLHKAVVYPYCILTLVHCLTVAGDTRFFTGITAYFVSISVGFIAYMVLRFVLSLKQKKLVNVLGLVGILVLGATLINDILVFRNIMTVFSLGGLRFTLTVGMVFYVFCYSLLIAIEYAETERREEELTAEKDALAKYDKMKTDLMATVAHETRTPLAVMSGYVELIARNMRRQGVDEQTAERLDRVVDEAQRIALIIEEMQALSQAKDSAGHKAQIQPAAVIRQVADLYAPILERKGITLSVNLPEECPLVFANAAELTQVIFNLLDNANKHTESGSVTITAGAAAEVVTVVVADTGAGISSDLLPRIFERGATGGKAPGSGLGLSLCKEIVTAHGGVIEIESEAGKGTAVRFTIPVTIE